MCDFRLIQRGEHGQHSNAHTSEEPPTVHVVDVLRRGLNSTTNEEDDASRQNG